MNKQTLVVLVGAIVLLGLGVFGALAFTGKDSTPIMTMPDGSTMPSDQMSTADMMTMEGGSTMNNSDMTP